MNTLRDSDLLISAWLDEGPQRMPADTRQAITVGIRAVGRHRPAIGWRMGRVGRPTFGLRQLSVALGSVAVVVIAAAAALTLYSGFSGIGGPLRDDPRRPFLGVWVSTSDADGGTQTMTIRRAGNNTLDIVVTDTIATVCGLTPSTMTATGTVDGNELAMPTVDYRCDDGREPQAISGPPLNVQLRNTTYTHDAGADTLTVDDGHVWRRAGAAAPGAPATSPTAPARIMWPQSTLADVRTAQQRADAGDADFTWQVDVQLAGDDYVKWERIAAGQVELVDRFVREVLGWQAYMHNGFVGGGDYALTDQRFLRCAPGRPNPLYPPQPESDNAGEACAPTLDELTYESVSLDLVQPDRQGPNGIWVVSNWRPITFAQADPAVAEAQATERLKEFLAARIAGRGAEGYVDVYADWVAREVPLLYATTSGAPYERFEVERVDGPKWPYGGYITFSVRLFADHGATVVEQHFESHWDGGRSVGIEGGLGMASTTTENGQPVPMLHAQFDGEVTYSSPSPYSGTVGDEGFIDPHEGFIDFTDPALFWSDCAQGPAPADAAAFAQAVIADPDFETSASVAARVGGVDAVAMDVALTPGGRVCGPYRTDVHQWINSLEPGKRLRLFLVDVPEGMSMRTLAITVIAPEARFQEVIEEAGPIIDSIEFHVP